MDPSSSLVWIPHSHCGGQGFKSLRIQSIFQIYYGSVFKHDHLYVDPHCLIFTKVVIITSLLVIFAIGLYATPEAFGQQVCCLDVHTGNAMYGDGSSIQIKMELEGIATSEWRSNNPVVWEITNYDIPANSTHPGGYNIVAQGTSELQQYNNNVLKTHTTVNSDGWDWTGPYTITASVGSYETTNYFNLWNRNLPVPSVPIAESNADVSGMCCIDVHM